MEKCYENFYCEQDDCSAMKSEKVCWECENTLCFDHLPVRNEDIAEGETKCDYCMYYEDHKVE